MSDDLTCTHPADERATMTYGAGGYLNVPTGEREVCIGCGLDFGPARRLEPAEARRAEAIYRRWRGAYAQWELGYSTSPSPTDLAYIAAAELGRDGAWVERAAELIYDNGCASIPLVDTAARIEALS